MQWNSSGFIQLNNFADSLSTCISYSCLCFCICFDQRATVAVYFMFQNLPLNQILFGNIKYLGVYTLKIFLFSSSHSVLNNTDHAHKSLMTFSCISLTEGVNWALPRAFSTITQVFYSFTVTRMYTFSIPK